MKTDDLIAQLAAETPPVAPSAAERRIAVSAVLGVIAAFIVLLPLLGLRPDMAAAAATAPFWMKFGFTAALGVIGLAVAARLARPGVKVGGALWTALALPVIVIALLGGGELMAAAPSERLAMWLGSSWRTCPMWIMALSAPVLAAGLIGLRKLAPTNLPLTGFALGIASGGLGATVYGLYCQESTAAFVSTWYVLGMALVGLAGATVGSRLLRW